MEERVAELKRMKDDAVEQLKQLSYSHKANEETITSLQAQLKEAKR